MTRVLWQLWLEDSAEREDLTGALGAGVRWEYERDAILGLRAVGVQELDQSSAQALWWTLRLGRSIAATWTVDGPFESARAVITHLEAHRCGPGLRGATAQLVTSD